MIRVCESNIIFYFSLLRSVSVEFGEGVSLTAQSGFNFFYTYMYFHSNLSPVYNKRNILFSCFTGITEPRFLHVSTYIASIGSICGLYLLIALVKLTLIKHIHEIPIQAKLCLKTYVESDYSLPVHLQNYLTL